LLLSVVGLLEFVGLVVAGAGVAGLGVVTGCGTGLGASTRVDNGLGVSGLGACGAGVLLSLNRLLNPAEYADKLNATRNMPTHFIDWEPILCDSNYSWHLG